MTACCRYIIHGDMQKPEKLTAIILEVFRLNGCLIESGNALVKDLGITSARWQVLGALTLSDTQMTVPDIARVMGLTRQSVQRLVNEMVNDGILGFENNIRHKRSKIVKLLPKGHDLYSRAMARQKPWVDLLAEGVHSKDLDITLKILTDVRQKLGQEGE